MNNYETIKNNIAAEVMEISSSIIPAIKEHPASLYDFEPIDQLDDNNTALFNIAGFAATISELLTNGYTTEALDLLNSTANSAVITLAYNHYFNR